MLIMSSITPASAKECNGVSFPEHLSKAWEEGFADNAKDQIPALRARIDTLKAAMGDMRQGQRLTFTHRPGASIQVDVNGALKATIEGDDFAKALLPLKGHSRCQGRPATMLAKIVIGLGLVCVR